MLRALLILLVATPAFAFTSDECAFTASFPRDPNQLELGVPRGYTGRGFHVRHGDADYGVTYIRHPKMLETTPAKVRRLYNKSKNELVRKLHGSLVFEREIRLGEHVGREIVVRTTNIKGHVGFALLYTERIFVVGDTFYVLHASAAKRGKEQLAFLDSFTLTKDPGTPQNMRLAPKWVAFDDGMRVFTELPAHHLRDEEKAPPWAADLGEDRGGPVYGRIYHHKTQPLIFSLGTLRVDIDATDAEAILNAARVDLLRELKVEPATMTIAIDKKSRILRVRGKKDIDGEVWMAHLDLHLTPWGLVHALVLGRPEAMSMPEAARFLSQVRVAKPVD